MEQQLEEYLTASLEVGRLLSDFEDTLGVDLDLDPADYDAENYSAESEPSLASKGKSTALMYSRQCAQWSMGKGRGHDLDDESVYMFISHYVDITDDDRNAYDMYLGLHTANTVANKLYHIYGNLRDLAESVTDATDALEVAQKMNVGVQTAVSGLGPYNTYLETEAVEEDIFTVVRSAMLGNSEDNAVRLSAVYDQLISDDDLFRGVSQPEKIEIVESILSGVATFVLGCVTGGLVVGIMTTMLWKVCGFGADLLTSEISATLWGQLTYSYGATAIYFFSVVLCGVIMYAYQYEYCNGLRISRRPAEKPIEYWGVFSQGEFYGYLVRCLATPLVAFVAMPLYTNFGIEVAIYSIGGWIVLAFGVAPFIIERIIDGRYE